MNAFSLGPEMDVPAVAPEQQWPPALYTIGYEKLQLPELLALLAERRVTTLIDVRAYPYTNKPDLSREPLQHHLAAAGMGYQHWAELGCPSEIRARYQADRNWDAYREAFTAYLRTQVRRVRELATLAHQARVVLLCREADPFACHRSIVAEAAYKCGGPEVVHLRQDEVDMRYLPVVLLTDTQYEALKVITRGAKQLVLSGRKWHNPAWPVRDFQSLTVRKLVERGYLALDELRQTARITPLGRRALAVVNGDISA